MNMSTLIVGVAVVVAAGSASAQQAEFIAPDAGFRSAASRVEVRQELANSYASGKAVQQQRDGQDRLYTAQRSRQAVRSEMLQSSQTRHGSVNNLYFGA